MFGTPQTTHSRIAIVGTSGAGKTTLAREVAKRLNLHYIELDALYWDSDWQAAPVEIFRDRVDRALESERWVTDGNYRAVRYIIWSQADTVVFLDYSFGVAFTRLLRRTLKRAFKREELWNGNQESIRLSFFSTDSVLLWMIRTYSQRRKEYRQLFQQFEETHLSLVHLRSPAETKAWLLNLSS